MDSVSNSLQSLFVKGESSGVSSKSSIEICGPSLGDTSTSIDASLHGIGDAVSPLSNDKLEGLCLRLEKESV